jgi:hypothetical protein
VVRQVAARPKPAKVTVAPAASNFLDEIKSGNFKLRKKEDFAPLAAAPKAKPSMENLSIADLQVALRQVREAMECSESSSAESNKTTSSSW